MRRVAMTTRRFVDRVVPEQYPTYHRPSERDLRRFFLAAPNRMMAEGFTCFLPLAATPKRQSKSRSSVRKFNERALEGLRCSMMTCADKPGPSIREAC